ncbi:hypothetical protein ACFQV2_03480 [Actinokineospora soli]|uniref:Peptidase C39-like domain-containing protein n=1 Tax=Actinokineospora soli TaxID=1048753 RepID=A0ABW2TGJ0_9PSEU
MSELGRFHGPDAEPAYPVRPVDGPDAARFEHADARVERSDRQGAAALGAAVLGAEGIGAEIEKRPAAEFGAEDLAVQHRPERGEQGPSRLGAVALGGAALSSEITNSTGDEVYLHRLVRQMESIDLYEVRRAAHKPETDSDGRFAGKDAGGGVARIDAVEDVAGVGSGAEVAEPVRRVVVEVERGPVQASPSDVIVPGGDAGPAAPQVGVADGIARAALAGESTKVPADLIAHGERAPAPETASLPAAEPVSDGGWIGSHVTDDDAASVVDDDAASTVGDDADNAAYLEQKWELAAKTVAEVREMHDEGNVEIRGWVGPPAEDPIGTGGPDDPLRNWVPQGRNDYGFQATCWAGTMHSMLNSVGMPTTQNEIVRAADDRFLFTVHVQKPELSGELHLAHERAVLAALGVQSEQRARCSVDEVVDLVEQGHAVAVHVSGEFLINADDDRRAGTEWKPGSIDHSIHLLRTVYMNNDLVGFIANDPTYRPGAIVDIEAFEAAWRKRSLLVVRRPEQA